MIFEPRPYQRLIIAHELDAPRGGVWAGMGMGKTSATLAAIDARLLHDGRPTLVLAPKPVAEFTWPREVKKWENFSHMDVVPIIGDAGTRRAALKIDAPIFTVNYENVPWLVEQCGDAWPFAHVVADESTRLKSFRLGGPKGRRVRPLAKIAHSKIDSWTNLTGTPSPNGLGDLWGQSWFLDRGERLGKTFSAFEGRWFQKIPVGNGGFMQPRILAHAEGEIHALLRDLHITVDPADWFDLRDPIVNVVRVELPAKARRLYDDMEKEMFMTLGTSEVEAFNAASRTIKCLQLANGAAYVDEDGNWNAVHDAKLQALESIVEEAAGATVLVAYHFRSDLERLKKAFPHGIDLGAPGGLADALNGKGRIWFGHPASMGHGVDGLQEHCNILAMFGHWWNLEEFQQVIERIGPVRQLQSGHDRPVFIHHIVAADTVDETIMARRESKRAVQDLLLEAMKRRAA